MGWGVAGPPDHEGIPQRRSSGYLEETPGGTHRPAQIWPVPCQNSSAGPSPGLSHDHQLAVGAKNRPPHATWACTRMSPPSRSRRMTLQVQAEASLNTHRHPIGTPLPAARLRYAHATLEPTKDHHRRAPARCASKPTSSPTVHQNRTPQDGPILIMHRDRTPSHAQNNQEITTALPRFMLPLLPPGAGSGGSTHGSWTVPNRRQRASSDGADLRHLEKPQVRP
jgi:hypothetical protein